LAVQMMDVGDGTYSGMFVASSPTAARGNGADVAGEGGGGAMWQLSISVQGVPIAGSPFAVKVGEGKKEFVFEQIMQGDKGKAASFDGKGVLYWIGTQSGAIPYTNPCHTMKKGGVRCSFFWWSLFALEECCCG
jgi:hypothetical protein